MVSSNPIQVLANNDPEPLSCGCAALSFPVNFLSSQKMFIIYTLSRWWTFFKKIKFRILCLLRLFKGSRFFGIFNQIKLRGNFIFLWEVLDYSSWRSRNTQLASGVAVPLQSVPGTRTGSKQRAHFLSNFLVWSRWSASTLPFCQCFLVKRKIRQPLVMRRGKCKLV